MPDTGTSRNLQLTASPVAEESGCGCGGCGCGGDDGTTGSRPTDERTTGTMPDERQVTTQTYAVTGMTCGHCASAVSTELTSLKDVTDVRVDLVVGGISTVMVTSRNPLEETQVATALEEAGEYSLA